MSTKRRKNPYVPPDPSDDYWDDPQHSDRRHWHIAKRVDITTLLAIGGAILGGIWWMANLQERITVIELEQGMIDERMDRQMDQMNRELSEIDERLDYVDERLREILAAVGATTPRRRGGDYPLDTWNFRRAEVQNAASESQVAQEEGGGAAP